MSVGIVDKQTGDRIPTAGIPAIDDALDLTSVNPVQNAVITAALVNKQDKTDNSLQTTDKTVVGAINEHEGDIGSLRSGLTNLTNDTTTIQTLIGLGKTTIVSGGYVQIGKAVIVTVSVTLTGNAGALNAEISGFPITINNVIIHVCDGSDYTKVTTARISNGVLYFDTAMTAGDYVLSGSYIVVN